jgi:Methylamine utilisation protein MauE
VTEALTPLLLAAAVVLCAAGVAKLGDPSAVTSALAMLGLPARAGAARALGGGEIAIGVWAALHPTRLSCALLGVVYATLSIVALMLARRRATCGCFGTHDTPASGIQSLLSAALAAVALISAAAEPPGLHWILGQAPGTAAGLIIGTAGVVYGAVLVYTELPRAWSAWSAS